jgi:hypothetical protein
VIDLAEIRRLWEETPASASQIGEQFGMSRNVVIALAAKHRWQSYTSVRGGKHGPRTMTERLDALHAELDRVLLQYRRQPRHIDRPQGK